MPIGSIGSRVVNDQISGWLEDYLRPKLGKSRKEFLWKYLCIFDRWSRYHARTKDIDDQTSLAYLTSAAEDALRGIASKSSTRLWLQVVRSVPLPVVAQITMTDDKHQIMELVRIASHAACLYGDPEPAMLDDNALAMAPKQLKEFLRNLSIDVPRFLGAAHAWYYARGWYRIAGKGGRLIPPKPINLTAYRKSLEKLPADAIPLVPSVCFANDDEIMPQVRDYDRRVQESGSSSISGFVSENSDEETPAADPLSWWKAGFQTVGGEEHKTEIYYPLQHLTLITASYFLFPDQLKPHLERLAPFAELMPEKLGVSFESFALCCRAVAATLRIQTGFEKLRPSSDAANTVRFQAEHDTLGSETLAAGFLYSVMQRGLMRAPRDAWITTLTALVTQGGAKHPSEEVENFISRFTRIRRLDTDFEPSLFLQVDPKSLALDILSMTDFFEHCLRKVTSIDDAADPDARRGSHFERAVWALLSRNPSLRLAVELNKRLAEGTVQGEIDIAFFVDDVLVVLECKSWQKTVGYFRGDRVSVERRHRQLRRIVEQQIRRNVTLLTNHLGRPCQVLAFICVAGPEFVWRDYPGLWYGQTCRVVTPRELMELLSDGPRWQQTVQAAAASSDLVATTQG